ncbi:Low-density lipoprotein receptor-related protein 1B [Papilio machaon]|uniref:Low-density lipoprotein receptor-related protein 1B n=1 Tax=Papilio machaon TaxID=76193 RepID=A0A0N1PGB4_PAPMA|nr:Low-density lipoprotein receptor-related protein 1B [Papilio machaon]
MVVVCWAQSQRLQRTAVLSGALFLPAWGARGVRVAAARPPHAPPAPPGAALLPLPAAPPAVLALPPLHTACPSCVWRRMTCVRATGAELDSYLVVCRGAPAMVQALALDAAHAGWEPLVPATRVARPTAADVDLAAGWLYYCDVHRYEISRQRLDGSEHEVFLSEDVDNCEGIAIDPIGRNVYWTDDTLGRVSVARLGDATRRRVLVHEPHYNPRAIALDPPNGVMYWSVWASAVTARGRIETANMDGSRRRTLLDSDLHWPNGLAYHQDTDTLYWCDTYLNKIERLRLRADGRHERELVARDEPAAPLRKPYGLALYEGAVVWSEHGTGSVRRLRDGRVTQLAALAPPLYDIRLVSRTAAIVYECVLRDAGGNLCAHENGGCEELCLAVSGGHVCACAGERALAADGRACVPRAPGTPHEPRAPRCPPGQFHCKRGYHLIVIPGIYWVVR